MEKEKINEFFNDNTGDNYTVNRKKGIKGFKDFRLALIFNSFIHIIGVVHILLSGPLSLLVFIILLINLYCIMLQRYNWIRIKEIIKRGEKRQIRQKEALLKDLKELDSEIDKHSYKQENRGKKEAPITYDDFCKGATLEHLKQYKTKLENMKRLLEYMKNYESQNDLEIILPKNKQKFLDINYKGF